MNWEAIGVVAEIVGAAAVIVTLIYLSRQIRFASEESRVQSTYASLSIYSTWRAHTINNPDLLELIEKANQRGDVTPPENARLGAYFEDLVMASYCSYATGDRANPLYNSGAEIEYLARYLEANPAFAPHWEQARVFFGAINNEFPKAVDVRRAQQVVKNAGTT